jgi:integrase
MAVTALKRNIPTVAQAIEQFVSVNQHRRGNREHISVLLGPRTGRVTGKKAAGPTLARSNLGGLRFDRVTGPEFADWFHSRHPAELHAASTLKRGRSSLRQLLVYAIANGWAEESVLASLPPVSPSPPRREWLRPEQVALLDGLVSKADNLTPQQRFMWRCLLNAGLRPEELVRLKPQDLNATDRTLTVIGKGRGDGKLRTIPVSQEFMIEWQRYVLARGLQSQSWLFPVTAVQFAAGARLQHETFIADASRHCTPKAARTAVAKVRALAEAAAKAGTIPLDALPPVLTPKVLRRTYACMNLIASSLLGDGLGLDLRSLQLALGHERLDTTAMYLSDVSHYLNRYRRPVSISDAAKRVVELTARQQAGALAA